MSPHTDPGELLAELIDDAISTLHHDTTDGSQVDNYERECLRKKFSARLSTRQAASQGSAGGEADTSLQNPQTSPERPDHAQAPISCDDLTDYVVDAALSEYWDLSPRGWSETQRVAMRKAILTALAVPSAHRGGGK